MNKFYYFSVVIFWAFLTCCSSGAYRLTDYVNPFMGTATLWDSVDLGYTPTYRAWGAEGFPGATLPHAMVQVTPVTLFGSGSGYQYEDTVIYAFFHTSMGHWNLGHLPVLPFTGEITAENYRSGFSHDNESARPGYYQVYLQRYGINAEMTSTLRCAYHRFTYKPGAPKKLKLHLSRMNRGRGLRWDFNLVNEKTFSGSQGSGGDLIYFYAVSNHNIESVDSIGNNRNRSKIINFADNRAPLELKIGFSFVSIDKAKQNLEAEIGAKSFENITKEADATWEEVLSKIEVTGGTERQRTKFYSCMYRSFLWPALRSDVDGEYVDQRRNVVNKGFHYYTNPAFWDDYRNKLVLMGMVLPEITNDIINSIIDRSKISRFMPTYFHGDFAPVFVSGMYLRGLRGFDADSAYYFMLRNATIEDRRARPYLNEYIERGWIAENFVNNPTTLTEVDEAKAAVTKTLEYSYTDYAVALMAKELGDMDNHHMLMQRSNNFKNLFDESTGFMRGRLENGEWWSPFDPGYPYYVFMYREANAWQASFFAPHNPLGLINLFPSKEAFEKKLDEMFVTPWGGYEAHNFSGFIGQYCHGNQPSRTTPYMYYFVDRQEKAQAILDTIMNYYYGMGREGLAYAGMDDSGELSAWYVLNAIGLYTFSPATPEYIVSVPLFDKVVFDLDGSKFTVRRENSGRKITNITYDGNKVDGYFISHDDLKLGKELVITVE